MKKSLQRIDINSASVSQLASVRGISPALAKRIVAHRPFRKLKELLHVRGVAPDLFERLSPQFTIKPFVEKTKPSRTVSKLKKEKIISPLAEIVAVDEGSSSRSEIVEVEIAPLVTESDQTLSPLPLAEIVAVGEEAASRSDVVEVEIVPPPVEEILFEQQPLQAPPLPTEPRVKKTSTDSSIVLRLGLVAFIFIIAFVLIGFSFSFGWGSSSQQPTQTAANPIVHLVTQTATPAVVVATEIPVVPSATPARQFFSSAGMAGIGAQIFNETFDSPKYWELGESDFSSTVIANRKLTMRMKQLDKIAWTFNGFAAKDFYFQGTVVASNCSDNDYFGLIFRSQTEDRRYFFGISCGGRYRVVQQRGQQYQDVIAFTLNPSIISGPNATNLLAVRAQGTRLLFYINDQDVASLENADSNSGRFGMFSKSTETQNLQVDFDDIAAWEIKP